MKTFHKDRHEEVILPLGPHAVVAVSNLDEYIEIPAAAVRMLNEALVVSARSHVFVKPGTPVVDWILSAAAQRAPRTG